MDDDLLQVWVLAASTGGIKAVPEFLSRVPCSPRIAFVYVQHLAEQQHGHLINIIRRHCDWSVCAVNYGSDLRGGCVVIPSAEERFDIGEDGLVGVTDSEGWKPPYSPNVDDVAVQVARFYKKQAGIIVFTGMGNDGCRGCEEMQLVGGRIWVQSPETCAAVSMPQAVLSRFDPELSGSVSELADTFNQEFNRGPDLATGGEER